MSHEAIEAYSAWQNDELKTLYLDLKRVARSLLRKEHERGLLQTTALVNEAFVKLLGTNARSLAWANKAHFFDAAVRNMRWVLVEQARHLQSRGQALSISLTGLESVVGLLDESPSGLLLLDDLLEQMSHDPALPNAERVGSTVNLRLFLGLTIPEIAIATGVSLSTAERDWAAARAWLAMKLNIQTSEREGARHDP